MPESKPGFSEFFRRATSNEPYPYQRRLAEEPITSRLLRAPTGAGKTAAAILAWLWRRQVDPQNTPRRLIYCLPMRVLVEQTRDRARGWVENLGLNRDVAVYTLMGGEVEECWELYPERPAILIGTQDMLLSRALNRGYAMSRYRWPVHFGLLNNDCLWIFDEVQLMDAGVATSAQLEAFRRSMSVCKPVACIWMSATLDRSWLNTIDFSNDRLGEPVELAQDKQFDPVKGLYEAFKPLEKSSAAMGDHKACAQAVASAHRPGGRTIAVFNTVARAIAVYRELVKLARVEPVLIHSRFRPRDRQAKLDALLADPPEAGLIVVATQVVEAGVDVSAQTLFTELAPWASLVQRFGRCNRRGEYNRLKNARIYWFDPGSDETTSELAPPYEAQDLKAARQLLSGCESVAPADLDLIDVSLRFEPADVIRRRELLDLFDTTPDLAGSDIDVSRFIRSGEDLDVQLFWRVMQSHRPASDEERNAPDPDELCPAPFFEVRDFVSKKPGLVWRWNPLERHWIAARPEHVYPGQTFLVDSEAGGYTSDAGWNRNSVERVSQAGGGAGNQDAYEDDSESAKPGVWLAIGEHTDQVLRELDGILDSLAIDGVFWRALREAARWHDAGKAHEVFQKAVAADPRPGHWAGRRDVAKAPAGFWRRYERRHFRHELASALAMLEAGTGDLAAYVAAAHHGKVRLSIRSFPGEKPPAHQPLGLYARGVWDGDELPGVDLGGGISSPPVRLSLQYMQLGRSKNGEPSWAERMLGLRDKYGPFRLAYLEALLRAADMRASRLSAQPGSAKPESAP